MISVIGLGQVGIETFKELSKKIEVNGVDMNKELINELSNKGFNVSTEIKQSDIYVIAVYTTEQVFDVLNKIDTSNNPLIIIESTIDVNKVNQLEAFSKEKNIDIAIFPHRFNPNDKDHHVFNLNRIMGGSSERAIKRALKFYKQFMDERLIKVAPIKIAALSKILENAYRFIEIAIAESLKIDCDKLNINFDELRKSTNTKWNIDIKEARDGIYGKCLPKDTNLLKNLFKDNKFIDLALEIDKNYKKHVENNQTRCRSNPLSRKK